MNFFLRLAALFLCGTLTAETFYVDGSTGLDLNSGTSPGAPWKHVPGDASATGVPAAALINGDTIYLKGGSVYALSSSPSGIVIDSSHYNTANGATIASGAAVGWGAGNPVIDGAGVGKVFFQVLTMTNVTLRGIEGRNSVLHNSSGVVFLYNSSRCLVDGLVIHDCNINENSQTDGIEVSGNTGGYNTVTNCAIWNTTEKDIEITGGTTHNLVINNRCGRTCDHGIAIGASFNTVVGNVVSNVALGSAVYQRATAEPAYGIKIGSNGPNYPASGNLVYNNVIRDCRYGGFDVEAVGTAGTVSGNRFFNNTMINCDTDAGGSGAHGLMRLIDTSGNGTVDTTVVQNNLFCTTAGQATFLPDGPYVGANGFQSIGNNNLFSHNLWFASSGAMKALIVVSGTQAPTLANFSDNGSTSPDYRFKVASYGSGNSFASASQLFNVDPLFTAYPDDLTLSDASPARAAGTNLSAVFTTDIRGATRSNWSMGAYEYGGTVTNPPPVTNVPPSSPTGLGLTVAGSAGTLTWNAVTNATGYNVYRSEDVAPFAIAASGSAPAATVLLNTNVVTRFQVTATNAFGESGPSSTVTNSPAQPGKPHQPKNLQLTDMGDHRRDFQWVSDVDAGNVVERAIESDPFTTVATLAPGIMHWTDNRARHKTTRYRVRSCKASVCSATAEIVYSP